MRKQIQDKSFANVYARATNNVILLLHDYILYAVFRQAVAFIASPK